MYHLCVLHLEYPLRTYPGTAQDQRYRRQQQSIPILTVVPQHHTTVGTLSKVVSSVMPILEGSWGRSIKTVSHPATKVRHGCRLSCCDGHGLRISTVNLADEPRWKKRFPSPPLRVCCCKPAFSIHLVSGSRLQEPNDLCIPLAALRHHSCEGLPHTFTTFAAVGWCGANGAFVTKWTGRWGSAAPVLLLIGSSSTGTMGCTI